MQQLRGDGGEAKLTWRIDATERLRKATTSKVIGNNTAKSPIICAGGVGRERE